MRSTHYSDALAHLRGRKPPLDVPFAQYVLRQARRMAHISFSQMDQPPQYKPGCDKKRRQKFIRGWIFAPGPVGSIHSEVDHMMKRIVSAACAASVLSLSMAAAQTGSTQTGTTQSGTQGNRTSAPSTPQETMLTGCIARGSGGTAQNGTFMLNNAQMGTGATASAGVSGSTSARSGVSGSGTGSTTAGTSGTASARTGDSTTSTSSYMLVAGANQNLANYVGQRVEVRGRMVGNMADTTRNTPSGNTSRAGESGSTASGSNSPGGGSTSAQARAGNERSANNMSRFQVTSVRSVGGTCQ
jgi:hypothetical protein